MIINTRLFGEIDVEDDKMICFPGGIIGFPELKDFALIYDEEQGINTIKWLQSVQEPGFALPVMDPLYVCPDYNPIVDDELIRPIGELDTEQMLVLVTVTIPHEIEKMTVNLRGPIVINASTRKACQVILEGDSYPVRFPIYEILKANKEKAGE